MTMLISGKNVYWSKKYESVVNRLVGKDRDDRRRAFETNMDVLVFAAFVGMKYGVPEKTTAERFEVPTDVFNNRKMYHALFLIPLLHTKDANILRQEKDSELLTIFQEFANSGLGIIQSWLDEAPTDIYGDKVLMKKLFQELSEDDASDFDGKDVESIKF